MRDRLRILTANLWNGRADPARLAALIEAEDVDVACVQELSHEQAEALACVLPYGRLEPAGDFTGMGIALRRPAEVASLPLAYRPLRTARLDPKDWPGLADPLAIWNVHVRAPHSFPQHTSFAIRRRQLRELLDHLREAPARLALVGDFNATPVWPVYRRLAAELRDAAHHVAAARGARPARTWPNLPGLAWLRLLRIDHAFVRGVDPHDVRVLEIAGSDHDAVCVDVGLGPDTTRDADPEPPLARRARAVPSLAPDARQKIDSKMSRAISSISLKASPARGLIRSTSERYTSWPVSHRPTRVSRSSAKNPKRPASRVSCTFSAMRSWNQRTPEPSSSQ
jgi:endonuclease/exonuclease/phosphatase (EEP) superfamily protein YafD